MSIPYDLRTYPREMRMYFHKRLYEIVHKSFIHNNSKLGATQTPINLKNWGIIFTYSHNRKILSNKNEKLLAHTASWMKLSNNILGK